MTNRLRMTITAATVGCALAAPAVASAKTFCVSSSGAECSQTDADVQSALQDAAANAGADTVKIGPGTYSRAGGFTYSAADVVHIVGAGPGATILTGPNGTSTVLGVTAAPESTVESLGVLIPAGASGPIGVSAHSSSSPVNDESPLSVDAVSVTAATAADSPLGVALDDVTLTHSTVDLPNIATGNGTAARIDQSTPSGKDLSFDTLKAHTGVHANFGRITDVDVTANRGIEAVASSNVSSSLVRVVGANGVGVHGDASGGGINMSVENDTIVGDGSAGSIGVFADGSTNGENLFMENSIVRGTATSIKAQNADLSSGGNEDYNDYALAAADFGGATHGTHDLDVDPRFVNPTSSPSDPAADYRLRFDSPVIDHGSPNYGPTSPDLDGNPRPGLAAADLGAYEYQRRAPVAAATASPAHALVGQQFAFDGSGSTDPDHGDALTYTWTFDDGTHASGPAVQHAFGTPGQHTGTLTVTDPTGLSSGKPVAVTADPPVQTRPGDGAAGGPRLSVTGSKLNGTEVDVTVHCAGGPCRGSVTETTVERLAAHGRIAGLSAARRKSSKRTVTVGSRRFSLGAGATAVLKVPLNSAGRKLLAKFGKLPVTLTVKLTGPNGRPATVHSAKLTVKPAKKHRHS